MNRYDTDQRKNTHVGIARQKINNFYGLAFIRRPNNADMESILQDLNAPQIREKPVIER